VPRGVTPPSGGGLLAGVYESYPAQRLKAAASDQTVEGTGKANWHYSDVAEGEFICVLCGGRDDESIAGSIYIPPKILPR